MACTAFFSSSQVFAICHVFDGTKYETKIAVLIMTLHSVQKRIACKLICRLLRLQPLFC